MCVTVWTPLACPDGGEASLPSVVSGYNTSVKVATRDQVGVRDLKNNLSRYLDRVQRGEEIIEFTVTLGKMPARADADDKKDRKDK